MKSPRDRGEVIAFAAAAIALLGVFAITWRVRHARAGTPYPLIAVPYFDDTLALDGELDEPSWLASARSAPFVATDGKEAAPYSDARFVWTRDALRIGLYAADEDIVTAHVGADGPVWKGDAFHVVIDVGSAEYVLDVGPSCVLTDGKRRAGGSIDYAWQSGARLACDADGTIDTPGDRDEEWVVEMEIPLASLGLAAGARADVHMRRCDANVSGVDRARCGEMKTATLVLSSR